MHGLQPSTAKPFKHMIIQGYLTSKVSCFLAYRSFLSWSILKIIVSALKFRVLVGIGMHYHFRCIKT